MRWYAHFKFDFLKIEKVKSSIQNLKVKNLILSFLMWDKKFFSYKIKTVKKNLYKNFCIKKI